MKDNKNQTAIIQERINILEEANQKMTIWPLIEAGMFKNLSEGLDEDDDLIVQGKTEQAIRNAVSKLPDKVKSIGNLVLINRSTELYKIASRATQYGDFMARAVYYQHLLKQGMEHDQIIRQVNEEFINYNFLPGRLRSGLERSGITWFWSYKIRSIKIMLQMMRKNPFRTLVMNTIIPDLGGPVQDSYS